MYQNIITINWKTVLIAGKIIFINRLESAKE